MKEIEPIVRIESDLQTRIIDDNGSWTTTYVFFQSTSVTAQSKILSFQNLSDRFDGLRDKKVRLENLIEIISKFSEARDAGYLFAVHDGLFDDVLEEHYHLSENDDLLHEQGRLDLALWWFNSEWWHTRLQPLEDVAKRLLDCYGRDYL